MKQLYALAGALALAATSHVCVAQQNPVKPIRVIIAQAPGSATDVVSRIVGNKLSENLGQPLVIEPRPGAGGTLGTEAAARAAPDGYTRVDMVHVPYKGTTPAITALLAGEVSVMFATITGIQPHIKTGRVRGLGVTTATRSAIVPEMPTVAEGGLPGFEMASWFALFAPAATPAAIVTRLNTETAKVLALPDVRSALATQGLEINPGTSEQLSEYMKRGIAKLTKLARAANIKAE